MKTYNIIMRGIGRKRQEGRKRRRAEKRKGVASGSFFLFSFCLFFFCLFLFCLFFFVCFFMLQMEIGQKDFTDITAD